MVRTIKNNYTVWLAGYYDDFTGARAIPDDLNEPSISEIYDHKKSHYGNPMNGEATLNPRYRWSFVDRDRTIASTFISNSSNKYEGRAQLQYPDGHIPNRSKYGADSKAGTDGYQLFCNGHNTNQKYIIATGDNDSTFGRKVMKNYTDANFNTLGYSTSGEMTNSTGNFLQRGHLVGVWTGEKIINTGLNHQPSNTAPHSVFAPLTSPSKQPFMAIQAYHRQHNSAGNHITMCYDGSLNSRLNGDVFTIRLAVRSLIESSVNSNSDTYNPRVNIELGSASPSTSNLDNGLSTIVVSYNLDLSSYNTLPKLYGTNNSTANNTKNSYNNDNSWIDIEIILDYDNNLYKVYQDGVLKQTTSSFTITPEQLYGWQITTLPVANLTTPSSITVFVDRAALYHPLSDHLELELPPIESLNLNLPNNGVSSCSFEIADDKLDSTNGSTNNNYSYHFKNLFTTANTSDWHVLFFGNDMYNYRMDRPLWIGLLDSIKIKQSARGGRKIIVQSFDKLNFLNSQLPSWEIGQSGLNTDESSTPYWLLDAQGFNTIMNMGVRSLLQTQPTVGFDKDDAYLERLDQRTQLGSGHPIQMYNNEDLFGPNNIWEQYEGLTIIGIGEEHTSANNNSAKTVVIVKAENIWSSGTITIRNTLNHNVTATPISSTNVNGNTKLYFNQSDLPFTAESAKIMYAGKYSPTLIPPQELNSNTDYALGIIQGNHPHTPHYISSNYHVIFDKNPNLNIGDKFYVGQSTVAAPIAFDVDTTFTDTVHEVMSITEIFNYFTDRGAGDYNTPAPDGTTPTNVYVVETFTEYDSNSGEYGDYPNDNLKGFISNVDVRLQFSKETGQVVEGSSSAFDVVLDKIQHKAIHAKWMTDLPKSLWFQYHFGLTKPVSPFLRINHVCNLQAAVSVNDTKVKITPLVYNTASSNGGIAELEGTVTGITKFIYQGKYNSGSDYYLIGCKFISSAYQTTESTTNFLGSQNHITYVNLCIISNDYKHLWLLWADMRNNGKADADGGFRKTNFGLQSPINSNYELSLSFTDQTKTDGTADVFTDLKYNSDYVMWDIDATTDKITQGPFSKPVDYANSVTTGISFSEDATGNTKLKVTKGSHGLLVNDYVYIFNTNKHNGHYKIESKTDSTFTLKAGTWKGADGTAPIGGIRYAPITGTHKDSNIKYHNWEDKAGAFVVVDTSLFFNLNTIANKGRANDISGQRTNLGDYDAQVEGKPILIDNYWGEALATHRNIATPFDEHPNARRLTPEVARVNNDILAGRSSIAVNGDDIINFPVSGQGKIIATLNEENESRQTQYVEKYFVWNGKQETGTSYVTGNAVATNTINGVVYDITYGEKLRVNNVNFVTVGIKEGARLYKGTTEYIINSIVTTNTTNDTLVVIKLQDVNGLVNLNADGSYQVENFVDISTHFSNSGGDAIVIPSQLYNVWTTSASNITASFNSSPNGIEKELMSQLENVPYAARVVNSDLRMQASGDTYKEILIYSSVGATYALRLMMNIKGDIKSENTGSFYESDKLRLLYNSSLVNMWLPSTQLSCISDINNIPITTNMTLASNVSTNDSYGSILDTRGQMFLSTIQQIQKQAGSNVYYTSFSYLQGRDGRLELRPKYNLGIAFTRNNLKISEMDLSMAGHVSIVRVYYGDGKTFVDYPTPVNLNTQGKWKIEQKPGIQYKDEALAHAKNTYNNLSTPPLRITAVPTLDSLDEEPMLSGGRYGYIADPQIALLGYEDIDLDSSSVDVGRHRSWTFLGTGGVPFSGMVNALDGNLKTSTDIYNRYGQSTTVSGSNLAWDDNYYWYGAKSLSYALQIVHIPKRMPYVSEATNGEELRVWIALKNGQSGTDINNAEFVIGICDYVFSTTAGSTESSSVNTGPVLSASLNTTGMQSVIAKQNGFYEITIPASYSPTLNTAGAKLIVSFNADYCRALLRHRCGNPNGNDILKNKHDVIGYSSFDAYNANSIFPLGVRKYDEMLHTFSTRSEWHGPRIQITNDFTYTPATFVTYTDAGLNLNSESMVIKQVSYNIGKNSIKVNLKLEKDESKSASNVISYLFPTPAPPAPLLTQTMSSFMIPNNVGTIENETNPNTTQNIPDSGTESVGIETNYESNQNNIGINNINDASYGNIQGRMALVNDSLSHQGIFGILGQKPPTIVPSSMKSYTDTTNLKVINGAAIKNSEGYSLPPSGSHPSSESSVYSSANIETVVSVPSDALSEQISVTGIISCGDNNSTGVAQLILKLECIDTGASVSKLVYIPTNTNRKNVELLPITTLSGAKTQSNRLKLTISRANNVKDTATKDSVILNDIQINFLRAGMQGKAQSNSFRPYH